MSIANKAQSKRLLAVHGWSAVILGLFLYVVVLTGSVAVLSHEIGLWSGGGHGHHNVLEHPLHDRIVELVDPLDPAYHEEVSLFQNAAGSVFLFPHGHETTNEGSFVEKGVRYVLDPVSLEILQREEGTRSDFAPDHRSALDRFIVDLHVRLHAPNPWGLFATGILGFVMLSAAISGIILHKHLIKDLFVAPRLSGLLLNRRDRHILAGSWSLPFSFILAFTGAFFSFAGTIGLPIVAMAAFGGDQVKAFEAVRGTPAIEDERPAPIYDLDAMLAESKERVGSTPQFLTISNWGRADAKLTVFHGPAEGKIQGSNHVYNAATGAYEGVKPLFGEKPSLGSAVFAWVGPLHFGNFAGLMSKAIWVALGLATCYVTLTGLQLWTQRRHESAVWRSMSRAIPIVGYGTPLGLLGAAFAFFASYPGPNPAYWTAVGFIAASIASIIMGLTIRERTQLSRSYQGVLAAGLVLLPILRVTLAEGLWWPQLISQGSVIIITMDLLMLVCGLGCLAMMLGITFERAVAPRPAKQPLMQPAE
ncbi:MAG: PepSY-associated TM helix domain-containing protein [Pseudomonadota bacterium]